MKSWSKKFPRQARLCGKKSHYGSQLAMHRKKFLRNQKTQELFCGQPGQRPKPGKNVNPARDPSPAKTATPARDPSGPLYIFSYFNGMFHIVHLLRRQRSGGQIFKEQVQ